MKILARLCLRRAGFQAKYNNHLWNNVQKTALYSTKIVDTLKGRGLVNSVTHDSIYSALEKSKVGVYCGVDPTAPSLHVGNLIPLMGLLHFHLAGHRILPLVGSATGAIGDPSGKSTERGLLASDVLNNNVKSISAQLENFFERAREYAEKRSYNVSIEQNASPSNSSERLSPIKIVRNGDWYGGMGVLEFLRDVGKHARVGVMLARESVKARMSSEQGISFTEFSYQLLQAYDFWYLYKNHGCKVQLGGSDQWGNITAGTELIRRLRAANDISNDGGSGDVNSENDAFGITFPLLTTSTGEKFGKSAGNAIWLDSNLTSPFDFYQFFVQTPDADVERYLLLFTLLPVDKIAQTIEAHKQKPEDFTAQKLLASEVTEMIHGENGFRKAIVATDVLFGKSKSSYTKSELANAFANDPRLKTINNAVISGKTVTDLAVISESCKSKGEANRLIKNGGLYWNNQRVTDPKWIPSLENGDYIGGSIGVLRTGKTNYRLLQIQENT
ncbi:tyrosyl-tRNA synthetase [Mycoemilia scoparia]|uniref:Tyrosine--tRNA ligase n=1 Tax=Mycoemilia scoparia TaxID=417184 RepID=A0A9W8A6S3_9FUNG|nr:tyrosyl-tRNA synthetase [Mycoemilia scoparia]